MADFRGMLAALGRELDAAAERWIGYARPPLPRLFEGSAWRPDDRSAYCGRCGQAVGAREVGDRGCAACRARSASVDAVVRLGAYEGDLRAWIHDVKYERWAELGLCLGARLGAAVAQTGLVARGRAVVVPMPMPTARRVYRGIDHARVIATGAARVLDLPVVRLLAKSGGPPQVALAAGARRRRGGREVRLRRAPRPLWGEQTQLLLVDDVLTTGASVRAAASRLRALGPSRVVAGVLAVADPPGRGRPEVEAGDPAQLSPVHLTATSTSVK